MWIFDLFFNVMSTVLKYAQNFQCSCREKTVVRSENMLILRIHISNRISDYTQTEKYLRSVANQPLYSEHKCINHII